jgi:hypothetical protein
MYRGGHARPHLQELVSQSGLSASGEGILREQPSCGPVGALQRAKCSSSSGDLDRVLEQFVLGQRANGLSWSSTRKLVSLMRCVLLDLHRAGDRSAQLASLCDIQRRARRCKGFDPVDDGLKANRAEKVERVLGAGQLGVDDGVGRRVPGSLSERACPLCGGERVVVSMHDEQRRGAAPGIVERRGGE